MNRTFIKPDNGLPDKINGVQMGVLGTLILSVIFPEQYIRTLSRLDSLSFFIFGDINQICLGFILISLALVYQGKIVRFSANFILVGLIIIGLCAINYIQTGISTGDYELALNTGGFLGYMGAVLSEYILIPIQSVIPIKRVFALISITLVLVSIWIWLAIGNTLARR